MDSLGARLKRERELRGIELEEISNATFIHPKHLIAIEEDRFERIPGLTFLRGYIKNYAEFIGLDSHEILIQLQLTLDATEILPESKKRSRKIQILILFLVFILFLIIVFLIKRH